MRTVHINIVPPKIYIVSFRPDSSSLLDDTILVASEYQVTTDAGGNGSIDLPVPASGALRYEWGVINGDFGGVFYLAAGSPINLDDLIVAGVLAEPTVIDYIDQRLAAGGGTFATIASGPTITMNAGASNNFKLIPAHTISLNFTGGTEGQQISLWIKTLNTTPRTITFGTNFLETIPFDTGIDAGRSFLIKFLVVNDGGVLKALEFGRSTMLVEDLQGTVDLVPTITTNTLQDGIASLAYNQTIIVSSGDLPNAFSIISGSLPTGLFLNSATGVISGTPTVAGTFSFTVRVTDADGDTADQSLTIVIAADTVPNITTTTLPNATQSAAYSQTIVATGGNPPVLWSVLSGTLPTGLTLNNITGALTGTPTGTGASTFTVRATDVDGDTDDQALTLTVDPAGPGFTRLTHGSISGGESSTVTIDTTGAKLIVAAAVHVDGSTFLTFTDTKGNTWTALTERSSGGAFGGNVKLYYCINPTVGTGHGFTWAGTSVSGSLAVYAYGATGGTVTFDGQSGAGLASSATIQPGSITPTSAPALLVLGVETFNQFVMPTVNSSFTVREFANGGGAFFDAALADFIQSPAAAINPTVTSGSGGAERIAAAMAAFKIV